MRVAAFKEKRICELIQSSIRNSSQVFWLLLLFGGCFLLLYVSTDLKENAYRYNISEDEEYFFQRILPKIKNVIETNFSKIFEEKSIISNFPRQLTTVQPAEESFEETSIPNPKFILLASFWRSGSSWLGELLQLHNNSFYLYEPIHSFTENSSITLSYDVPSDIQKNLVKRLFNCGVSEQFSNHVRKWSSMYPHPRCKDCISPENITAHCLASNYRIMKTVRLSMESVEELLVMPSMSSLKVIYLVRDPRGVINSVLSMEKPLSLKLKLENVCPRFRGDLWMYSKLQKLFPNRLYFLRYEDIATNAQGKATELWRFIQDDNEASPPEAWITYMIFSEKPKKKTANPYDTQKKSTRQWQSWRFSIKEEWLKTVQDRCSDVILTLGYRHFDGVTSVRNLSLPVLTVKNCTKIPCYPL